MKYAMVWLSSIVLACLIGCTSTVTPPIIESNVPSWDGSDQNSGFYGFQTNTVIYGVISQHARERYNILIKKYKSRIPTIYYDYGIIDNGTNCYITLEGLSNFMKMNRWNKQNY